MSHLSLESDIQDHKTLKNSARGRDDPSIIPSVKDNLPLAILNRRDSDDDDGSGDISVGGQPVRGREQKDPDEKWQANEFEFDYALVNKPAAVSALMYFRAINLFLELDPLDKGFAPYAKLKDRLEETFGKELKDHMVLLSTVLEEAARVQSDIHIDDFLLLIAQVQTTTILAHQREYMDGSLTTQYADFDPIALDEMSGDEQQQAYQHRKDRIWCACIRLPWRRFWLKFSRNRHLIPIWRETFREIEARFGSSVVSYFYFAQEIFWLNLFLTLLFLFIVVPCMISFDWSLKRYPDGSYVGLAVGFGLENSWLFYGGYAQRYGAFQTDLAWIILNTLMLIISLLLILRRMDQGYSLSSSSDSEETPFSTLVFAGWDNNITSSSQNQRQTASMTTSLNIALKEASERRQFKANKADIGASLRKIIRRSIGYLLTAIFCGATCAMVGWLIYNEGTLIIPSLQTNEFFHYFATLLVPALVTLFKVITPPIIFAIVEFEQYDLSIVRFRNVFSRIFIIRMFYVFVVFFQTIFLTDRLAESVDCQESLVGIIYYKLIIVDLVGELTMALIFPFVKVYLAGSICPDCFSVELDEDELERMKSQRAPHDPRARFKKEFTIQQNIIDIMYKQALVWSGTAFCPMLPLLAVICNFCIIYAKRIQVLYFCKPPVRPMGVTSQDRYFRSMLVITLTISIIPFSFFLRREMSCGPHNGSRPIDVFFDFISTLPPWVSFIWDYTQNVLLLWLILIIGIIYVIYLYKKRTSLKDELHVLRRRLKIEVKEKQTIIRENGILLDSDSLRGKTIFKTWMEDMGAFGDRYSEHFQDSFFDNIFELAKLSDHEVVSLMQTWRTSEFQIPDDHIEFFVVQLAKKRRELI